MEPWKKEKPSSRNQFSVKQLMGLGGRFAACNKTCRHQHQNNISEPEWVMYVPNELEVVVVVGATTNNVSLNRKWQLPLQLHCMGARARSHYGAIVVAVVVVEG